MGDFSLPEKERFYIAIDMNNAKEKKCRYILESPVSQ